MFLVIIIASLSSLVKVEDYILLLYYGIRQSICMHYRIRHSTFKLS